MFFEIEIKEAYVASFRGGIGLFIGDIGAILFPLCKFSTKLIAPNVGKFKFI